MAGLEHNSIVPLYEQVFETIRGDILSGRLAPRQRIPSESELAEHYSVSIITIRRAISELVKEGLVEKKQGKGTFVCAPQYSKSFSTRVMSFTETCEANGLKASAKVLFAGFTVPDRHILDFMGVPPNTEMVHILRLRLANEKPCVIEENFFPTEFQYLLSSNLEGSLYQTIREEHGTDVLPGRLTLKIVRADKKTADLLNIARNTPLLKMVGRSYQPGGEILHACIQTGYGEEFDFVVR